MKTLDNSVGVIFTKINDVNAYILDSNNGLKIQLYYFDFFSSFFWTNFEYNTQILCLHTFKINVTISSIPIKILRTFNSSTFAHCKTIEL